MGYHSIEPNGGQQHGNYGEDGRHRGMFPHFGMLKIHAVAEKSEAGLQGAEIFQHDIGIQFLYFRSNGWCQLVGRRAGSHKEKRKGRCFLPERQVDKRFEMLPGGITLHDIGDDAYHRAPLAGLVSVLHAETLADRLFARPELDGKALVHNRYRQGPHTISVIEFATRYGGCSYHAEVVCSGGQELGRVSAVGPSLDLERAQISGIHGNGA